MESKATHCSIAKKFQGVSHNHWRNLFFPHKKLMLFLITFTPKLIAMYMILFQISIPHFIVGIFMEERTKPQKPSSEKGPNGLPLGHRYLARLVRSQTLSKELGSQFCLFSDSVSC